MTMLFFQTLSLLRERKKDSSQAGGNEKGKKMEQASVETLGGPTTEEKAITLVQQ